MFSDSHAALHCSCASNDDSCNTFNLHISALRQHSTTTTPQSTSLGLVFDYISATHYHTVEKTSQHHVSNRSRTQVTLCKPTAAVFDGDIKQEIISSQHLPPQTDRHCTGTSNNRDHLITAPASTDRHCTCDIKQQRSSHHSSCLHRQTDTAQATSKTEFIILSQHLPPQTDSLNRSNSSSNFQHFSTIRQTPI